MFVGRYGTGGFWILAFWGLRLIYKGVRGDIYDGWGERNAPRWGYIVFGLLCEAPLIGYLVFLHKLG